MISTPKTDAGFVATASRSHRSRVALIVVLALTLVGTTAWGRGGGGGHFGGGMGDGHVGSGFEGEHSADRSLGESRGFEGFGGGRSPRLDHDREMFPHLNAPYNGYGFYDPGYGGYCGLYSSAFNSAYCDY